MQTDDAEDGHDNSDSGDDAMTIVAAITKMTRDEGEHESLSILPNWRRPSGCGQDAGLQHSW